ncbi:MAG: hypothetical protein H6729_11650 [Deltaproteobacteria bacterium]|nr:hypothetical protein [Deltaproteobacteria bacterium]
MMSPILVLGLLSASSWATGCEQPTTPTDGSALEAMAYMEVGERELKKGTIRSAFFAFKEALRYASLSESARARAMAVVDVICDIHGQNASVAQAIRWIREGQHARGLSVLAPLRARAARLGVDDKSLSLLVLLEEGETSEGDVSGATLEPSGEMLEPSDATLEPSGATLETSGATFDSARSMVVAAFGQIGYDSNIDLTAANARSDGLLRTGVFVDDALGGAAWARAEGRASMDKHFGSSDLDLLDVGGALEVTWHHNPIVGSLAYDVDGLAIGWAMSVLSHGPRVAVSYDDEATSAAMSYGLVFQHGFDDSSPAFSFRHLGSIDWTYRPLRTASQSMWGRWAKTAAIGVRYLIIRASPPDASERFLEHQPVLMLSVSPSIATRLSAGAGLSLRRFDAAVDASSAVRHDLGVDGYLFAEWDATEQTTFFLALEGRNVHSNIAAWSYLDVVAAVGVRWVWGAWSS